MRRGFFITFEGIEGSGKSTQARLLVRYLAEKGIEAVTTEEPGGTPISRKIREVLLSPEHREMDNLTELLLYNAARRQHLVEFVLPALSAGKTVVCDRFSDSTKAYQGYGRGIDIGLINNLDKAITGAMKPDLTILLDMEVESGLMRNKGLKKSDRLELEEIAFHERVRDGYHQILKAEPDRVKRIDASSDIEGVSRAIGEAVSLFLERKGL